MTRFEFTKYFLLGVFVLGVFGFVVPAALSDPSDAGVCFAVMTILGGLYFVGYVLLPKITQPSKEEKRR